MSSTSAIEAATAWEPILQNLNAITRALQLSAIGLTSFPGLTGNIHCVACGGWCERECDNCERCGTAPHTPTE